MTNYSRKLQTSGCVLASPAAWWWKPTTSGLAASFLLLLCMQHQQLEAASARLNGHHVTRQQNKYFLNEFCDLKSKTLRSPKKYKQATDTHSLYLTSQNTQSSLRVVPQKQVPSSISFGFGSSGQQRQEQQQQQQQQQQQLSNQNGTISADQFKQLNCSIIVVGPKSHGLLVTVNSIGLPKNLTKLGIILNHDSPHAQHIHLEGETKAAHYLLTEQNSSSIAINLQTFQPIDWSRVSFDIVFTVYKKVSKGTTGCPNKNWFDCGDNICVPSSSVCDNNLNCPNGSDELTFYHCYSPLFWSIAASTALALIIVILIVSVLFVVKKRRISRLGGRDPLSMSDNALASEGDLMANENNSSKLDLTQAELAASGHHQAHPGASGARTNTSYLASNLYLSGFENPVWQSNGTLTKQQQAPNKK